MLLDDTEVPYGLSVDEEREACRALKGSMLRQEVYALDGTAEQPHPYTVKEQNFTIELVQPRGINRHAVFFTHARESISYLYERNPADPRVSHAMTLEVDRFGDVLKQATISYARRQPDLSLAPDDQATQAEILITYTENDFTNTVDLGDDYRTPAQSETRIYELTGLTLSPGSSRFTLDEIAASGTGAAPLDFEQLTTGGIRQKRLIEQVRIYYRANDLTAALSLGQQESLALPFESYKLAFTPGMVTNVYAGRVTDAMLADDGRYTHTEGEPNWWAPSGRTFYSPAPADTAAQELAFARAHFFLPHRFRDPFHTDTIATEAFATYDAYNLLVLETRDAVGNRVTAGERDVADVIVTAGNNYRVLQPELTMDPNRNRTASTFDALGMVVGTAVMGKPLPAVAEGDLLTPDFEPNLTDAEVLAHLADPLAAPQNILRRATTRFVYDLFGYQRTKTQLKPQPSTAYTLARETHDADPVPAGGLRMQHNFSYSDGFGREIQRKAQAEPGPVPTRDVNGDVVVGPDGQPVVTPGAVAPRWAGTGWTIFNNKGKPVRQYEAFFTDTHRFEFDVRIGVSPVLLYDPVERVVATLHPDHTWQKSSFDAWRQDTWDTTDTALIADPALDPDVGDFFQRLPAAVYLPTWYAQRIGGALGPEQQAAARQAATHAGSPTVAHADPLGRTFLTIAHNKFKYSDQPPAAPPTEEFYGTRAVLDIKGNRRAVVDAKERVVMQYDYDVLGNRIHQASMEAGDQWILNDCSGKALYTWDSFDRRLQTSYDPSRRPVELALQEGAGAPQVVSRTTYGEAQPNPEASNFRTKAVELFDQGGILTTDLFDFKGNPLRVQREIAQVYDATLDWSGVVALTGDLFVTRTGYDALNRAVELTTPDNSLIRHTYNEANLLNQVDVNLLGAWTPFITNIEYSAKGQRTLIDYGNAVTTRYEYDPLTFRLLRLETSRDAAAFPGDCPQPPLPGWPGCELQDLRYTYDPAGNVTNVRDNAQQTVYFQNRRVEPSTAYTYDAVYRLVEAVGREHLGQVAAPPTPYSYNDRPRIAIPLSASDGNAVGRYLERYHYDSAGNIVEMQHVGTNPANPGWTRTYAYQEASLLEPAKQSNRLTRTTIGATVETYSVAGNGYDAHGSMRRMPHLQAMQWDFRAQLQMTRRQAVNPADADGVAHAGEQTWYTYDASGQRVRKVTEVGGVVLSERIYVGAFEVYRNNLLVRETLHITDGERRFALVETRTDTPAPQQLIRYQLDNHLGSSSLELDELSGIISYEEYTPYGSTSFQAVRGLLSSPKRYRYVGKERDEETGFAYHAARYYAPWLGRWTSCDPSDLVDGFNLYAYGRDNPVNLRDTNGRWSWGKTLGLIAAIGVGVAVTALTGGIAGPIAAGIIGGAFAGAAGEVVEAAVDGRPITARNVLVAAGIGAVAGGVFAGAGQLIAGTQIGQRLAARVATSAVGQGVARMAYRVATSPSRAAGLARGTANTARAGVEALQEAGEAVGRRMGGRFAANAAAQAERRAGLAAAQADAASRGGNSGVQATLQGELNGEAVSATTRSGIDRSGTGIRAIETPGGRVAAPAPDALPNPLQPLPVSGTSGQPFVRSADAEIKLFGHTLLNTTPGSTGRLYLGVTAPMCPSCSANLWNARSALPGVRIISDMPSPAAGAAGAGEVLLPPPTPQSNLPPPIPVLQLQIRF
jgi:RHS repeat-associated protein